MGKGKGKPKMQIRKPPADEPDPNQVAAFIGGDSEKSSTPEVQKSGSPDGQTSTPERRQTTIYFDPDVFRRLKVHCVMEDAEMSATVTEAVRRHLDALDE